MARENGNLVAAAAATLPQDLNRTYLYLHCSSGAMTVQIDSGATLTLNAGSNHTWEPRLAPTNALTISGTGVMITG